MDVKTLCLAVLHGGEATGYEIKKAFEEGPFSHFQTASFGSIYPSLNKLATEGLVTVEAREQDGRPDKKVYRLTPAGRRHFTASLMPDPGRDAVRSDFLFLMFFAQQLAPGRAETLIDRQVAFYRGHLDVMNQRDADCDGTATQGQLFVRGFGRAIYQAAADYLEANRDHLTTALRADVPDAAE
jgi:PadR family transcriptional regulator AphA